MSETYIPDCDEPVFETIQFLEYIAAQGVSAATAIDILKSHRQTCEGCHLSGLEIVKMESANANNRHSVGGEEMISANQIYRQRGIWGYIFGTTHNPWWHLALAGFWTGSAIFLWHRPMYTPHMTMGWFSFACWAAEYQFTLFLELGGNSQERQCE